MGQIFLEYFVNSGVSYAVTGAIFAVALACIGSAWGIRISTGQAAGVLSEKPELFGKMLVIMALPGTQGFYGFICAFMIWLRIGLLEGAAKVGLLEGIGLLFVGIGCGLAQMHSARFQGESAAAAINLTARRPDQGGRAILLPALVETYAVVALLSAILAILWLTPDRGLKYQAPRMVPAAAAPGGGEKPAAQVAPPPPPPPPPPPQEK